MKVILITSQAAKVAKSGEHLLVEALKNEGAQVDWLPWDQVSAESPCDIAIIRTTWDYTDRQTEFFNWLDGMEKATFPVFNSVQTVRWNVKKTYLRELQEKGAPLPPSYFWEGQYLPHWDVLEKELGPAPFVFKPIISAGARGTFLVQGDVSYSAAIDRMKKAPFIAQKFLRDVRQGEISAIVFDGKFSHSVLKVPGAGDFRVQTSFGGHVDKLKLDKRLIQWAEDMVALCPERPLLARVDFVLVDSNPVLMELEVFEPELFFEHEPESAPTLARLILAKANK